MIFYCFVTFLLAERLSKIFKSLMPFVTPWMNLEGIIQVKEVRQRKTEKDKFCMVSLILGIKKNKTNKQKR